MITNETKARQVMSDKPFTFTSMKLARRFADTAGEPVAIIGTASGGFWVTTLADYQRLMKSDAVTINSPCA